MTQTTMPENYKRVLNLIKVGGENAITGAEIANILKIEKRAVQEIKPYIYSGIAGYMGNQHRYLDPKDDLAYFVNRVNSFEGE